MDDLTDIHDHIAADSPVAAGRLVLSLLETFERTADYPKIGRAAHEVGPGFRLLAKGAYVLVYRVIDDERVVELVRVIHAARDWPTMFDS